MYELEGTVEALKSASLLSALPFDARDARILGDPVGCVVFVGRHKEGRVEEVVFVEASNGEAESTELRQSVKNAVEDGRVRYIVQPVGGPAGEPEAPMAHPPGGISG